MTSMPDKMPKILEARHRLRDPFSGPVVPLHMLFNYLHCRILIGVSTSGYELVLYLKS